MKRFVNFSIWIVILCVGTTTYATGTSNWKAPDGYEIRIDSSGWSFPVAIAFVKNPATDPKSPLYYVSELRGRIKVVTQDRSVYTYADQVEELRPQEELPAFKGQFGLTGLCLDDASGSLYATTVYRKGALLFNKIMRFNSPNGHFGLQGNKTWELVDLFQNDHSGVAHQIGHCFIGSDGKLYVGVGDAHKPKKSQLLQHTNGKLLRLNLDGTAPSDNPLYDPHQPNSIISYVYAYGFRNPFAISEGPSQQVYVAENGKEVDRLILVNPGQNYLWEGQDDVMFTNSLVTWSPPIGPATMIFLDNSSLFPQWDQRLLISATFYAQIQSVWIDESLGVKSPPIPFMSYAGSPDETQYLVPIAAGPDGIYFSGFMPQSDGETHIMKVVRQTSSNAESPALRLSGQGWYSYLECAQCHQLSGKGGKPELALDGLVTTPHFQSPHTELTSEQQTALGEYLMQFKQSTSTSGTMTQNWISKIGFHISTHLSDWIRGVLIAGLILGLGGNLFFGWFWKKK